VVGAGGLNDRIKRRINKRTKTPRRMRIAISMLYAPVRIHFYRNAETRSSKIYGNDSAIDIDFAEIAFYFRIFPDGSH
jgi:hypothetical protein